MSSQAFSDDQTIDRYNEPSIEHLISQNKMKDLALAKATNLIELLNIQLEVEKNSNEENIRHLEQELRMKYEAEIARLREKLEVLHRQLQRTTASRSNEKTVRQTAFVRANSLKNFENKKKRSINKKYTQKDQTIDSGDKNSKSEINIFAGVKNEYFKQKMLQFQQWKSEVAQELEKLVSFEYEQMGSLINNIEAYSDDFTVMMSEKVPSRRNSIAQLTQIVRDQQHFIHNLRAYTQDLEDILKSSNFKLNSFLGNQIKINSYKEVNLQESIKEVLQKVVIKRQEWRKEFSNLEDQNAQLRNILEGMIKLVREEKGIKS